MVAHVDVSENHGDAFNLRAFFKIFANVGKTVSSLTKQCLPIFLHHHAVPWSPSRGVTVTDRQPWQLKIGGSHDFCPILPVGEFRQKVVSRTVLARLQHPRVVRHVYVKRPYDFGLECRSDTLLQFLSVSTKEIQRPTKIDAVIDVNLSNRLIVVVDGETQIFRPALAPPVSV